MIERVLSLLREPSRLKHLPVMVRDRYVLLKQQRHARMHYARFLKSGATAIEGDLPYNSDVVHEQFVKAGYTPRPYEIDLAAFHDYCARFDDAYTSYRAGYRELFTEKALEHFVSLTFSGLSGESRVIDIANAGSPFPEIVHELYGCDVWSNDLIFDRRPRRDAWHTRIGGDACDLRVGDDFFDLAVLHCAFEMFESDADIRLLLRAGRMLKPGGKLVIIPLYMHERYHIQRDPRTGRNPLPDIDSGAELIYRTNFYGCAFARFYSVNALLVRLMSSLDGLSLSIYQVSNISDVDARCYLKWIAVFEKDV